MRLNIVLTAVAAGVLAACGTDEADGPLEPTGPFGRVRFVNAVPDTAVGQLTVTLDSVPFPFTAGLAYGAATAYQPVYTGPRTFRVRRTVDTTRTIADAPLDVAASTAYTVVAAGRAGSVAPLVLTDTITIQPTDSARVRVAHVAPSLGSIDVYVTPTTASIATAAPTLANLSYRAVSRYVRVPNGRLRVRVTPAGSKTVAADDSSSTLALGQIRTVLVLDRTGGGTPPRLVTLTDR